jgi:hypothetical protein
MLVYSQRHYSECCPVSIGALQISSSEEEDQGKYECVAENVVGTEYSHSTMLYVKGESPAYCTDTQKLLVQLFCKFLASC